MFGCPNNEAQLFQLNNEKGDALSEQSPQIMRACVATKSEVNLDDEPLERTSPEDPESLELQTDAK